MESFADQFRAFALAMGFHLVLIGLIWWSAYWILPQHDTSAAGEPIRATLQVSAADIRQAKAAIKAARRQVTPAEATVKPPQPLLEPKPQTSDTPLQMTPQAPQDRPDTVDQFCNCSIRLDGQWKCGKAICWRIAQQRQVGHRVFP